MDEAEEAKARRGRGPRGGAGDSPTEDRPDGFRPRRTRPPGWLEGAIADGSVRAPGAPDPDDGKIHGGVVIDAPMATAGAKGSEG